MFLYSSFSDISYLCIWHLMSVSYRPPDVGRVHPKVGDFVGDALSLSRQVSTKCDIAHLCRSHHLEESVAENIYKEAIHKSSLKIFANWQICLWPWNVDKNTEKKHRSQNLDETRAWTHRCLSGVVRVGLAHCGVPVIPVYSLSVFGGYLLRSLPHIKTEVKLNFKANSESNSK